MIPSNYEVDSMGPSGSAPTTQYNPVDNYGIYIMYVSTYIDNREFSEVYQDLK